MTPNLAKTLAQYNRWMNRRLYETCRELTDEQLSEDCGAYFKSIIGTLNHLYIGDSVWMARFTNQSSPYQQLNAIIYSDFTTLKMAREQLDEEIVLWADSVTPERLQTTLHYTSLVNPQPKTLNMDIAVTHFLTTKPITAAKSPHCSRNAASTWVRPIYRACPQTVSKS